MDNKKKILIGAGIIVVGVLAYNYFHKKSKVLKPKEVPISENLTVVDEKVELKPLKGKANM